LGDWGRNALVLWSGEERVLKHYAQDEERKACAGEESEATHRPRSEKHQIGTERACSEDGSEGDGKDE
jgi:hypothetical protein